MKKRLVVFYSFSGNTKALALAIAEQAGCDTRELIPVKPYAFDYNTASKEARSEIARGYCPKLSCGYEPVDEYDILLIGSPNWFKSIAPPVLSFLRAHDLSGKTIAPFCTHGGGGFGEIESQITAECPGADIRAGFAADDTLDRLQIAGWLKSIGLAD